MEKRTNKNSPITNKNNLDGKRSRQRETEIEMTDLQRAIKK
jgi:hypothetical protein